MHFQYPNTFLAVRIQAGNRWQSQRFNKKGKQDERDLTKSSLAEVIAVEKNPEEMKQNLYLTTAESPPPGVNGAKKGQGSRT